jgi:hypothetical protein
MGTFQDILRSGKPIHIAVDYYNDEHKKLFSAYANAAAIQQQAGNTIAIPVAEFLTYCLFVNKRESDLGLNSYSAIKAGLNDRLGDFNDGLALTPQSLRTKFTGNEQLSGLSEKIGVGISLSVVSRIHGLTEADWERLRIGKKKSLDFKRACGATGYVQVECKGTSVPDNKESETAGLRQFAKHISEKKVELRSTTSGVTAYGAIGAVDAREDSVMKCWLLDPPGESGLRDPKEQRILNRLFYIAELMEAVLPQSLMTVELYKRLAVLVGADDLSDYNNQPLTVHRGNLEGSLFYRKTHTADRDVLGVAMKLGDGTRFFYGLRCELLDVAYRQDFDALLKLQWEPVTVMDTVMVPDGSDQDEVGESQQSPDKPKKRPRPVTANLHTTSFGRVFGLMGAEFEEKMLGA